jgi:hypothetical protein
LTCDPIQKTSKIYKGHKYVSNNILNIFKKFETPRHSIDSKTSYLNQLLFFRIKVALWRKNKVSARRSKLKHSCFYDVVTLQLRRGASQMINSRNRFDYSKQFDGRARAKIEQCKNQTTNNQQKVSRINSSSRWKKTNERTALREEEIVCFTVFLLHFYRRCFTSFLFIPSKTSPRIDDGLFRTFIFCAWGLKIDISTHTYIREYNSNVWRMKQFSEDFPFRGALPVRDATLGSYPTPEQGVLVIVFTPSNCFRTCPDCSSVINFVGEGVAGTGTF